MLKTRMGTTIEFIKLDERFVKMVVSIPHTKGQKVVASPTFLIEELGMELAELEKAKPQQEQDDADLCGRLAKGDPDTV